MLNLKYILVWIVFISFTYAVDLDYSEIMTVTDETRYTTLHPEVELVPFNKVHHVKGNYVFSAGLRISGDHLLLNFYDEIQFTISEDIQVYLKYPASGTSGSTLTAVEIYVDLTSSDADTFFTVGGIGKTFAEMLMVSNKTQHYTYEMYMYGY